MSGKLTMREKILRACNGEIVQLPYDEEQRRVTVEMLAEGLIYTTYEDDQPTRYLTPSGRAALSKGEEL